MVVSELEWRWADKEARLEGSPGVESVHSSLQTRESELRGDAEVCRCVVE